MGWLDAVKDRKKLPKVFENKSEDDIVKMLEESAKDKEELQGLRTKVADQDKAVDEIKTEFDKVKSRLADAEANRNKPPEKKQDDEVVSFIDDPEKALAQRVGPLAAITIQNSAQTSRMLAQQDLDNADLASGGKTMDGRLFRAWSRELDQEARKYPTQTLTTPDAWKGIFYYLKGVHAEELNNPEIRKKKYNFLEPSSTTVSTHVEDEKKTPSDQLTDAEKHVADKMGVSHENYLKRKKAMTVVSA